MKSIPEIIKGKDIIKLTSSITKKEDVTFEVVRDKKSILARTLEPHDFKNGDYVSVSGISSQSIINLDGVYNIGVQTSMFKSATAIGNTAATGIVTYIPINGDVKVLQPDDIIGISTEKLFVLNIDDLIQELKL